MTNGQSHLLEFLSKFLSRLLEFLSEFLSHLLEFDKNPFSGSNCRKILRFFDFIGGRNQILAKEIEIWLRAERVWVFHLVMVMVMMVNGDGDCLPNHLRRGWIESSPKVAGRAFPET